MYKAFSVNVEMCRLTLDWTSGDTQSLRELNCDLEPSLPLSLGGSFAHSSHSWHLFRGCVGWSFLDFENGVSSFLKISSPFRTGVIRYGLNMGAVCW